MKKQPNNPAGRLLCILRKIKGLKSNCAASLAFSEVLGIEVSDTSNLLKHIAGFLKLGDDSIEAIKRIDVDHDEYIQHINAIMNVFVNMNLGGRINDIRQKVKDSDLVGLKFCDGLLKREMPEKTLKKTDLKKIYDSIESLIDEVMESDIDTYLKQYLLDKLDLLRKAIEMYDISGIKPIESAVNDILGSVCLNEQIREKGDLPETKKFANIVVWILLLIGGVNDLTQLPGNVQKILPCSEQVSTEDFLGTDATQKTQQKENSQTPEGKTEKNN